MPFFQRAQLMKPFARKIPTPQYLANVALHYLERYAASEASLRRVLENRLRRATMEYPDFGRDEERLVPLRAAIDQLIDKYKKTGVLNDAAFAESKVHSLRREGRSRRAIIQKLGAKGVRGALVDAALEQSADGTTPEEAERTAALAFAKRRKLGPFRKTAADPGIRRKDFAALARAGFSLHIAQQILKTEIPEEWE
jgi:regulatory protein